MYLDPNRAGITFKTKILNTAIFAAATLLIFYYPSFAGITELEKTINTGATSNNSGASGGSNGTASPAVVTAAAQLSTSSALKGYVNDDDPSGLNVRNTPWGAVIGNLKKGSVINITGREGDWYRIIYNGKTAYVYAALVKTAAGASASRSAAAPSAANRSASPSSSASTPYFHQYNNRYAPGASCQNTSVAMVLAKYGWKGKPDDITARFGRYMAQTPSGLASVFNTLARENGLKVRLRAHTNMTPSKIISLLKEGKPVITHGWFTRSGHVVTLTGYDGNNFKVNDPAGKWAQRFMGGYNSYASGNGVFYNKNTVYNAILEGGTAWAHEVYEI